MWRETHFLTRIQFFHDFSNKFSLNSEDEHIFVEFSVQEGMKDTFARRWICAICKLEKLRSHRSVIIYSREKIFYREKPKCFGSTPINEQTIDK